MGQNIDLPSILDQAGIGCPISLMQSMSVSVAERFRNFTKGDFSIQLIEFIIATQALTIALEEKVIFGALIISHFILIFVNLFMSTYQDPHLK